MKNCKSSLTLFSILFSFFMTLIFFTISYFYIKETINTKKAREEHEIACYINRMTSTPKTIKEFKEATFGTLESFVYKVAIYDKNLNLVYSTFKDAPKYNISKSTYIKNDEIFLVNNKFFKDIGIARVVLRKDLDYSQIENSVMLLILAAIAFFAICFSILYFVLSRLYVNINKNLNIFFKNAIHEIRTPLGVLQINLEFLENTLDNSMALKRARGGLNNLTSVYETIEYQIKHTKIKYSKENINLSFFLENRIEFFKVLADVKNILLNIYVEEEIFFQISRPEIQRLIDNNLSNAIKYSKENTQINIKLYKQKDFIFLEFENFSDDIKDSEKIFQRYYRGDDIKGGFGLGLDIVKHICNLYDIQIDVKSENKKIKFSYKLPNKYIKRVKNA